jgi:hypothetical protein
MSYLYPLAFGIATAIRDLDDIIKLIRDAIASRRIDVNLVVDPLIGARSPKVLNPHRLIFVVDFMHDLPSKVCLTKSIV